jgi:hypothetical protein
MNVRKDVSKVLKQLRKAGCEIDASGRHYKVRDGEGTVLFGVSKTPSDPASLKRIMADCRRAGLL